MNSPETPLPFMPERILMTTDTVGGIWDYSLELCRGLGRRGIEVILATMGPPLSQGQRIEAGGVATVQLIESRYRLEWMPDASHDIDAAGTWLELVEAQYAPDFIHLNGYVHATLPWSAPVVVVAHSDVRTWWEAVRGGTPPPEWDAYTAAVRQGLHAADLIVAPTRAMLDGVERHYGRLPAARVIPNGREPLRFESREKEAFVLSAGRLWDEAKNAQLLAEIAAEIGWPVKLAGEQVSPYGNRAQFRNVELLGARPPGEMADLFARASIYALPAKYEPFGLTVLEAGLSGCALVLGDIPSLRELWSDAAEFVPVGDATALRNTLSRLIGDPDRRTELAGRAYRCAEQFTGERMVSSYLEAYADASRAPRFSESESAFFPA